MQMVDYHHIVVLLLLHKTWKRSSSMWKSEEDAPTSLNSVEQIGFHSQTQGL